MPLNWQGYAGYVVDQPSVDNARGLLVLALHYVAQCRYVESIDLCNISATNVYIV